MLGLLPLGVNALIMTSEVYGTPGRIAASCAAWALPVFSPAGPAGRLAGENPPPSDLPCRPLSLLPLAVTPTLGQRLYFFPMVLLVLSAADAAAPLLVRRPCAAAAALLTAGLMLLWGTRSWVVFSCSQLREQLVQEGCFTGLRSADSAHRPVSAGCLVHPKPLECGVRRLLPAVLRGP